MKSVRWVELVTVAVLGAGSAMGNGVADLAARADSDYANPVRPGGVDGSPFWNVYARMFMYPPAFDFSKGGPDTVKYRFTVLDSAGKSHVFDALSSQAPLTPVWSNVAPGRAWVYVKAVDKDGVVHGIPDWPRDRFSRTFWRSAPFRPGTYPTAPRSYAEAVAKCGDEIFERPSTQYFLKNGKPDPDYKHNCYPAKMHSALIRGMIDYAKQRPARSVEALKLARNAADYLISTSLPKGSPLEYWPRTYADRREAGASRYGQNMLIYPCEVGSAYLALYGRVKEKEYLEAAKRIGDTYVRLQEPDGTWPIFIRESDGKVLNDNRVQPTCVIAFLEALYGASGEVKYRASADRAFAWIEEHPLKDWFWEGQFEDAPLGQKYENPSKHPACELAIYLIRRFPGDKKRTAVAREILRYAEDQFVCWERPCAANGHGVSTPFGAPDIQQNRYDDWFYPCALEQYAYYVPVDASNAKMIKSYLALYRAEKNPLDLAKARALGDALVRTQRPNGYIPTEYALVENRDNPMQGWLNCTCATLEALSELAEVDSVEKGEPRRVLTMDTSKENPRNGEGDLIRLKDGRVLFVYGEWAGGTHGDGAPAHLVRRYSSDGGETWTEPERFVPQLGTINDMSVSLLRMRDGRIALFYLYKTGEECRPVVRYSSDEGTTWSAAEECIAKDHKGYYGVNNARVEMLRSGRIIFPVACHFSDSIKWTDKAFISLVWSDDNGKTWQHGKDFQPKDDKGEVVLLQEPGLIELKDGRLYLYARSDRGCQWQCFSNDAGETWTDFGPAPIRGPLAPATIKRLRSGELLLLWNDHETYPDYDKSGAWGRAPLSVALSTDEGKTWTNRKLLESDPKGFSCYYCVLELEDSLLISYYNVPCLADSCVKKVPLSWLR